MQQITLTKETDREKQKATNRLVQQLDAVHEQIKDKTNLVDFLLLGIVKSLIHPTAKTWALERITQFETWHQEAAELTIPDRLELIKRELATLDGLKFEEYIEEIDKKKKKKNRAEQMVLDVLTIIEDALSSDAFTVKEKRRLKQLVADSQLILKRNLTDKMRDSFNKIDILVV